MSKNVTSSCSASPDAIDINQKIIAPGHWLGVFGGGQLGRMFAIAAQQMGYFVHVYTEQTGSPASQVAARTTIAPMDDYEQVRLFAESVDAVTIEFENIPAATVNHAANFTRVAPSGNVLEILQDRRSEKSFCRDAGVAVTPFAPVTNLATLSDAAKKLGLPAVLKSTRGGYDGHGQVTLKGGSTEEDLRNALKTLVNQPCVYEAFIDFDKELSVVAARRSDGQFFAFPLFENEHRNHILDATFTPADVADDVERQAHEAAKKVGEALKIVGVYCVEFFLKKSGELYLNEVAPRPHNSGHITIDLLAPSQFDLQVRAMCNLPLPPPIPHEEQQSGAMVNLLGDLWLKGQGKKDAFKNNECNFTMFAIDAALATAGIKLHLYGKRETREGRKMGHMNFVSTKDLHADPKELVRKLRELRDNYLYFEG